MAEVQEDQAYTTQEEAVTQYQRKLKKRLALARMTRRRFLYFRAIIARTENVTEHVEGLIRDNPTWDMDETKSWEEWKKEYK